MIHGNRRNPSVGRGTAPTSGDGDCPGGNPRARRRPTDMEAGTGCGGGTDGRTGIHAHSISVTGAVLGEQQRGARRRASGHGRGGRQARSRDATRDAAACGSSGGGAGAHDRAVRSTSQRCDAERQQHGIGRGPGQRRVKRRGATARYDTWHGLIDSSEPHMQPTTTTNPRKKIRSSHGRRANVQTGAWHQKSMIP